MPPKRELVAKAWRTAMPAVAESLMIALVSMVDSYMVSGLGDYAISAIGLTTQPRFLGLALFIALSQAVSLLVARRRGEGNREEANRILQQAVLIILILGSVFTAVCLSLASPMMKLVGSQPDTHGAAVEYFRILMAFMILNAVTITINGAQRGVGNTKIALKTNIVANAVNVVMNFLLIEGRFGFPRLEVRGAAIATVLGTAAATVMALISVAHSEGYLNLFKGFRIRFYKSTVGLLAKLGTPVLIEQLMVRVGHLVFFAMIARLGTTANAAHHIGMNFFNISFACSDGFAVTAVALVGRSLGAGRKDLAYIYSSICQRFGLLASAAIALIYVPFGRQLFGLFSQSPEVLQYGTVLMPLIAVASFAQISMIIYMSSLRAGGDIKVVATLSIIFIGIGRPLFGWIFCYPVGLGLVGAWLGMVADQTGRLIFAKARYSSGKWMDIKI